MRARLVDYLHERVGATPRESFSLGMTQQELAEELGTVREVIVRKLQHLRREGVIASAAGGDFD